MRNQLPPDTVALNYGLNQVIGDNETGFRGTGDAAYRTEGWDFILAGGALYNNLDYSFTVGHEDGTFAYPSAQPGGGTAALRKQLRILSKFLHGFDFLKMKPMPDVLRGDLPPKTRARVLAEPGKAYAVYITGGTRTELELDLPAGAFRAEWVNTKTGGVDKAEDLTHSGGAAVLSSPPYEEDVALRLVKK